MVRIHPEVNGPVADSDRTIDAGVSWPGARILVRERTGSTMDDCFALGRLGRPSGTTVVAGYQERGRGRAPGRRWLSSPWQSLLATVLVRPQDLAGVPSQLPLRAALAVCRAIDDAVAGARTSIKWPNDVMLEGRKVAGVLCELRGGLLLVGIGVNCLQRDFPPSIASTSCSIASATGRELQPLELCPRVLARLREAIVEPTWREQAEARLGGRGRPVRVEAPGGGSAIEEGVILGIDGDGSLLLRDAAGRIARASQGEISGNP
jgi:BirA family biotin operon repressor/biotin-[acetyl-CoA-carboxylase] ligase